MRARTILHCLALSMALIACGRQPPPTASGTPDIHSLQVRTFDSLWTTVKDNYIYQEMHREEWESLREEYHARLESELASEEFASMMEEVLQELPADTAWLQSREDRIEQASADNSTYGGIGSFIGVRGGTEPRIVLLSVMPESPAQLAGLESHDAVLAIDGTPVTGIERSEEVGRVRGPAGSEVTLLVRSPGEEPREVVVKRGQITSAQDRLFWRLLGPSDAAYFLFPPSDYEQLIGDFAAGLEALFESGDVAAVVLDLRIVDGADSWPAATLLTLFTDGVIGEVRTRAGSRPVSIEGIYEFNNTQSLPVAVLIGPNTTGAAEIFAAAMQASDNAILVGMQTPGDVESVSPYFLPDGSQLFVATSTFRPGNGLEIGLEGVVPDVAVAADWDKVTPEDDAVVDAALDALSTGNN